MELIIVKKIRIRIEEKDPEKCRQRAPFHGLSCQWLKQETEMKNRYSCMLYQVSITDRKRYWRCVREFGYGGKR